jgi:hypothetical protein
VQLEVGQAGDARVKRMIYPPGFRWSRKEPVVLIEFDFGTDTIRRLGMPEQHRH